MTMGNTAEKTVYEGLSPAFDNNNIAVVMAADNHYLRYLAVTLQSLLEQSSPQNNYDIIVLVSDVNADSARRLQAMVAPYNNFSLRFFDVEKTVAHYGASHFRINDHFSIATYYRFFITLICGHYDKVVYLDCDLVVRRDIAKLYHHDVSDYLLAGTPALGPVAAYYQGGYRDYFDATLGIRKPQEYFNAGVVLLNIRKFIEKDIPARLFAKLQEVGSPILVDQDILNAVCQGEVLLLDQRWNVTVHVLHEKAALAVLPEPLQQACAKAAADPFILHYTSRNKPWNTAGIRYSDVFWGYARKTPFYEEILLYEITRKRAALAAAGKGIMHGPATCWRHFRRVFTCPQDTWLAGLYYRVAAACSRGERRAHYKGKRKMLKIRRKAVHKAG